MLVAVMLWERVGAMGGGGGGGGGGGDINERGLG